ncbi:cytochrome P450 monooxygenase pc-3 [Ramaria rubella]|nr:cytochrome P450 monooxygenase pc-3 [Ramaria rubella]
MAITPGIRFLATTGLPAIFGPPLLAHAFLIMVSHLTSTQFLTSATLTCTYLFSLPAFVLISAQISLLKETIGALRLGALVVPRVEGRLPGNIDLLYRGFTANKPEYLGELWLDPIRRLGTTFAIRILHDQRLCTLNPKNVQKILALDFEAYRKGNFFNKIMESMLGVGVFNSDGEMWRFHRKMIRPFLAKERVADLELYEQKAALALQKLQDRLDAGYAVDFQDLVARFTLDSASEFLLGTSVNSLDSPLPLPHNSYSQQPEFSSTASTRFARAFATAQVTLLARVELGSLWPLAEIFQDKMKSPMAEIRSFIDPIVRHALKNRAQDGIKDEKTLLGHLMDVTDDMKMIVDETLNIMLAGRDTTASLLTFATYCLAMHPKILATLRLEIINTVGTSRTPSYDELRDMRYLRAVLNETLRLFPPVPFNLRETTNETTWLDDEERKLYVPANTRLGFSIMHLHRHEDYWGPDAHIYDPDRWLDSRVQRYTSNPFIFVPFNGGPRICPGQQFAYHETSFFLVRLLQRFEFLSLAPESQPPNTRPPASWKDLSLSESLGKRRVLEECFPRAHLTLYADGGLWIRAQQAEAM